MTTTVSYLDLGDTELLRRLLMHEGSEIAQRLAQEQDGLFAVHWADKRYLEHFARATREKVRAAQYLVCRLVTFFLRPGGQPRLKPCEEAATKRIRNLAEPLGTEMAGSLVITGPEEWQAHGLRRESRSAVDQSSSFVGSERASLNDVRRYLSVFLERSQLTPQADPVNQLAQELTELSGLLADQFRRDNLSPRGNQAMAALLELTRRLGTTKVRENLVAGDPEWLARISLPRFRDSKMPFSVALAFDEAYRIAGVEPLSNLSSGEMMRAALTVALAQEKATRVAFVFLRNGEASSKRRAQSIPRKVSDALAALGVEWGGAVLTYADGGFMPLLDGRERHRPARKEKT